MINENIKRLIIIFIITITLPLQKIVHAQLFYNDQQIISGESYDNVKLPNLEYIESNVDLRVKVLGGEVKLNRSWVNGRWYANPAWANLRFILDPLDNSVKTIDRAGTMYQRVKNDQLFTYETVAIKKMKVVGNGLINKVIGLILMIKEDYLNMVMQIMSKLVLS